MRFRRAKDDLTDGLSERDAARLRAALEQTAATPGLEGLAGRVGTTARGTTAPADPPVRRGKRS